MMKEKMKVLIIGASGYIGGALARALLADGYHVSGLARSAQAMAALRQHGLHALSCNLLQTAGLAQAVLQADPDIVVCTASAGGGAGDCSAFSADRDAVVALVRALEGRGKTLIFTSGSAVFGVFADGEKSPQCFGEDTLLPLASEVFAPAQARVPVQFVEELSAAISARVQAEQAVLTSSGLRAMVIRPGNVHGYGGSVDIPKHIEMARVHGVAPYMGSGATTHGFVHLDDLVRLYQLAITRGEHRGVYHAVAEELSQRELAGAISRMIGAQGRTESLSLEQMYRLGGTRGVRLSVNKRLDAQKTRMQLGWTAEYRDTLHDVEFGSYARNAAE